MDDREVEEINRKETERLQRIGNANTVAKMFVVPVAGFIGLGVAWDHMTSAMQPCSTIALVLAAAGAAVTIAMRRAW